MRSQLAQYARFIVKKITEVKDDLFSLQALFSEHWETLQEFRHILLSRLRYARAPISPGHVALKRRAAPAAAQSLFSPAFTLPRLPLPERYLPHFALPAAASSNSTAIVTMFAELILYMLIEINVTMHFSFSFAIYLLAMNNIFWFSIIILRLLVCYKWVQTACLCWLA